MIYCGNCRFMDLKTSDEVKSDCLINLVCTSNPQIVSHAFGPSNLYGDFKTKNKDNNCTEFKPIIKRKKLFGIF